MKMKLGQLILMIAVFNLSSQYSFAQRGSAEFGLNYGVPGGDYSDIYAQGYGLYIHPRISISDRLFVGVGAAANIYIMEEAYLYRPEEGAFGIVTHLLGTVLYKAFEKNVSPYLEVGAGMYFGIEPGEVSGLPNPNPGTDYEPIKRSEFGVSPKVGVMIGLVNAHLSYHNTGYFEYTQLGVGLRLGRK